MGSIVSETATNDKPVILVDGSSYLFRAYHALPPLTTTDGVPTGAVRGVIAMIRKLEKDYPQSPLAIVFDPKGKTFRDDIYPDYKANRPSMPEDLRQQIEPIHEIIRAMGLPLLIVAGVEADDVIGTLAAQATAQGRAVLISTSDKDMAQLVSEHVTLVNTMGKEGEQFMGREGVVRKFGVPPELIIDYLALMGDAVDNIPGVPKVGPKTAAKWLNKFGSLDGVMAAADQIRGKVGESLREHLQQLPRSRRLTAIKCDVEVGVQLADLAHQPADKEALRKLFRRLQFNSWLDELGGVARPPRQRDYECVTTEAALDEWIARLKQAEVFAFDTETTSVNYMQAELVGISFSVTPGRAAYVPVAHRYAGAPEQLPLALVLKKLSPLLEDANKAKLGQHLKYDINVLSRFGVQVRGVAYDTMLESYILDSTATRNHSMDDLASKYLDIQTIHYEDVAGKGAKQLSFDQVPLEQASDYAAEDADVTLQLHRNLWPKLEAVPSLTKVFKDIELPLIDVLARVERNGALLDPALLKRQSGELAVRTTELQALAWDLVGDRFNLDSPRQLQEILFQRMQLPPLRKTPKGQPSTAEPVLRDLANMGFELPTVILDYRGCSKLKTTYTDKLPLDVDPNTKRIHTSYNQAGAATGRLASNDPNLQNIPIRTAEGRRVRQAFIAPPGRCIVAADYSQIELRIMAHLSRDEALLAAFAANADVHRVTASGVFGVPLEQVSGEQRRQAKAINFGLMYGMSPFGISRQLGIDQKQAQRHYDDYFKSYPGVARYMDETRKLAHEQGFVETVFGRRLYLREINARRARQRQAAERTAINAPLQGTAADIIKRAMLSVDAWLRTSGVDALMIMQVHDELVFEVAQDAVETLVEAVRERMSAAGDLAVPLLVDCGVGANWDEAH